MPHKLRQIRKKRGSRTQGYGRVGQHRKSGSQGYRKAGRHKAGWSYVLRYEPDYFGKKGFVSPKSLKHKEKIINLKNLDQIAEEISTEEKEGKFFINLEKLGYTKLLGTGKVTKPLIVKIASYSSSAIEKIKEAGGEIMKSEEHGE
jgi:large subunit ribosomal protein L15